MEKKHDGQREHEPMACRELYEGYLALRGNACWQWIIAELELKREYWRDRLPAATDWPEFCGLRARLQTVDSLLAQVAAIADYGKEGQHEL